MLLTTERVVRRRMPVHLLVAPVGLAVSLATAKRELGVPAGDTLDDNYLRHLLAAAAADVGRRMHRAVLRQTRRFSLCEWSPPAVWSLLEPASSVTISEQREDGTLRLVAPTVFALRTHLVTLRTGRTWPAPGETTYPVWVLDAVCGWHDPATDPQPADYDPVPADVQDAVVATAGWIYDLRHARRRQEDPQKAPGAAVPPPAVPERWIYDPPSAQESGGWS